MPPQEEAYDSKRSLIHLPSPSAPPIDLQEAIQRRASCRKYRESPLSLEELSFLLYVTQGVKDVSELTYRTVPSAGARHAFETYLLVNSVEGLSSGLYRFIASRHKLLEVSLQKGLSQRFTKAALGQSMVETSALTFIWVAIPYRMTWRYGERGYRYLYLDAGHLCQNLYLGGEAIEAGVCAIAAFDDDRMNRLLNLDDEAFVIYLATVGKR